MGRITRVATQIADISATQKVFWRPHPDSSSDTRKAESKPASSALTNRRLSKSVISCIFFRHSKISIHYFSKKFK